MGKGKSLIRIRAVPFPYITITLDAVGPDLMSKSPLDKKWL